MRKPNVRGVWAVVRDDDKVHQVVFGAGSEMPIVASGQHATKRDVRQQLNKYRGERIARVFVEVLPDA